MTIQFVLAWASAQYQLNSKKNMKMRRLPYQIYCNVFLSQHLDIAHQRLKTFFINSLNKKVATWI